MTPTDVRLHLKLNRVCNMHDLTVRFNREPDCIRDVLKIWMRKGKVCCKQKTESCGKGCSRCNPLMTECYEWLGQESGVSSQLSVVRNE